MTVGRRTGASLSAVFFHANNLADLFPVFDRLEREPVALAITGALSHRSPASPVHGRTAALGFFSSGSTGRPKLVWRDWESLKREARMREGMGSWTWASPFRPDSFAGVQVALQAWITRGRILSVSTDWEGAWKVLLEQNVNAVSATPTYFDLLLQNQPDAARAWAPGQVTLGGEVLRPGAGARFASRFPQARFTVIYAAAESGVLLKTHRLDGWYEVESLAKRFPQWRVNNQILEVRCGGEWGSTGDRVEVEGELICVLGRSGSVANIAGTKVNLDDVTALAEQVEGVRRANAVGEPNAVTGEIVCLRFAVEQGYDPDAVQLNLQEYLRRHLRKEAWPRRWEPGEVGVRENGKR